MVLRPATAAHQKRDVARMSENGRLPQPDGPNKLAVSNPHDRPLLKKLQS